MRILESIFLILTLAALIWSLKCNAVKSRAFSMLWGCTFLALMLHLIIEGWRWQMVPGYGVGAAILIISAARKSLGRDADDQPRKWFRTTLKVLLSGAAILLVLLSGILSWTFPVFKLPEPTGPYKVGTSQWFLADKSRKETLTIDPDDYREISLRSWYPAEASGMTRTAEYLPNSKLIGKAIVASQKISGMIGLKWFREAGAGFIFDYFRLIKTHAYPNAAVSKKHAPYPVLIFSHGFGAVAIQNTTLMEELASHGYAVFSIGHTYESLVEIFPDGRQAFFSPPKNNTTDAEFFKLTKEASEIKAGDPAFVALLHKLNKQSISESISGDRIYVWSADTLFVIDWLEKMNTEDAGSPFYRQLDLNKLGVLGMSFGGATAGQVTVEDRRVKAAVNMDGWPYGDWIDHPPEIAFMFMNSEGSIALLNGINQKLNDYMMEKSNAIFYSITVRGSKHINFTDLSVWSPVLKHMGAFGTIDGEKMLKIMNAYTVAFFDKHLKGIDSPLLNGPSPAFPEVILKARNR
jgi:predicted dienelactone hydrolase